MKRVRVCMHISYVPLMYLLHLRKLPVVQNLRPRLRMHKRPPRLPWRAQREKATTATAAAPVTHAPALESDEDNDVWLTTVLG